MSTFDVKYLLSGSAFFLLLLSIVCRFMIGVQLKKLAKEAENMSAAKDLQLRQCRLKFQNCYELNDGNMNTEIFVEKFLQSIRFGKCSLRTLNLISLQFVLLFVLTCGGLICVFLSRGSRIMELLPYYLAAFAGIYVYFAVSTVVDVRGKREKLKIILVDFFENRMAKRLRQAEKDSAYLERADSISSGQTLAETAGPEHDDMPDSDKIINNTELEALLTEFLA